MKNDIRIALIGTSEKTDVYVNLCEKLSSALSIDCKCYCFNFLDLKEVKTFMRDRSLDLDGYIVLPSLYSEVEKWCDKVSPSALCKGFVNAVVLSDRKGFSVGINTFPDENDIYASDIQLYACAFALSYFIGDDIKNEIINKCVLEVSR